MSPTSILSAEELSDRLYPSNPTISNDGRLVAFVVAPVGRREEHDISAVWLSRDGQPARQFSSGISGDKSPVFSPDSTRLALLSDRHETEKYRLYVLPVDGGEATRLGTVEGDLSQPLWSPDGSHIAVLVTDPETEDEKTKTKDRNDPILEDQNLKFTRLFVINVDSGTTRQLTFGNRSVLDYGWSRDGLRLAVATSPRTDVEGEFQTVQLAMLACAGGRLKLLAELRGSPWALTFVETADGEQIAAKFNGFAEDPVDSIWLFSTATGEARELLTDDHGNVETIYPVRGLPNQIGLRLVDGVHANALVVDAISGERVPTLAESWRDKGSLTSGPVYSADGQKLALVWSDATTPDEVFVANRGGVPVAITSFGDSFTDRLYPTEVVEWTSDEWTIQGLLVYPRGYEPGKRYPLLIEAHGGPSWQWEDHCFLDWHDWAQFMAARGFAVLAPNPRGSTGRGKAFQYALFNDIGGGEIRDLITGVQAMIDRGIADPDRLGIGGWSWGGYLTATTITRTKMFKAAMMGAGLANLLSDHGTDDIPSANLLYFPGEPYHHSELYWGGSALKYVADCTTPTLVIHGDADDRVPPSQARNFTER